MSQRNCPVCLSVHLSEKNLRGQTVDVCPVCKGIFFDRGELESIVDFVKIFSSITLDEQDIDTIPKVERDRKLCCPIDGAQMTEQDIGDGFIIDKCEECGAIWLDDGELSAIQRLEEHIRMNIGLYIRLGQ